MTEMDAMQRAMAGLQMAAEAVAGLFRKAVEAVAQASRWLSSALQRTQRRLRRKEARRGGRRRARSVGPWGLPWAFFRLHEDAPLDVPEEGAGTG